MFAKKPQFTTLDTPITQTRENNNNTAEHIEIIET